MILLIDNYDSFVWNLAQLVGALGMDVEVVRNDEIDVQGIEAAAPLALLISPGPKTPDEAGVSVEAVQRLSGKIPLLGVCLGHQAIAQAFGGRVIRAEGVMHGKVSHVHHGGEALFRGIESPFTATRYHSLIVDPGSVPEELEVTAWTGDAEGEQGVETVQGLRHKEHPCWGVQFHPESVGTDVGRRILVNFLDLAGCL